MRLRHWNRWFGPARIDDDVDDESMLLALAEELEADLREVDFDEVTLEDRVTLVEQEVVWQVRCALARQRFDLALAIQSYGVRRIAELRVRWDLVGGEQREVGIELDRPQRAARFTSILPSRGPGSARAR